MGRRIVTQAGIINGKGFKVPHDGDKGYSELVNRIIGLWDNAKEKAITTVNTNLLEANWKTGQYIVEFEQKGAIRAEYGKQLLVNLSKDLTMARGKGFSRSNLNYMRKLYVAFPICETMSHKLSSQQLDYAMSRSMSPTMIAEYKRILIPQERMQQQLNEFCNMFLNKA